MLKVENVEVLGWEHAIRGMRNPKNSWAKSDSGPECPYGKEKCCGECQQNFCIGSNDKQLMMALRNAGCKRRGGAGSSATSISCLWFRGISYDKHSDKR